MANFAQGELMPAEQLNFLNSDVFIPRLVDAAESKRLAYIGHKPGIERDSDEWHTPDHVVGLVNRVLGQIDLDPFSCEEANRRIQAKKFITKEEDALSIDWRIFRAATVFMNPPYSGKGKFILELNRRAFKSAILLVNNATDTGWFHLLLDWAVGG